MNYQPIGKLKRLALNAVWTREPQFSRWLADNIDELNAILGLSLSDPQCEGSVGDFSVDIVAEDESGARVVIENQFGKSDHDHLGKLLTYLTGTDAEIAVWVVGHPRPEHVEAITWLNEKPGARFFLVKLEVVAIGESQPAPLMTVIVEPGDATGGIIAIRENWAERQRLRHDFWTGLLERAQERTTLHANISPSTDSWVASGAGTSGLHWLYRIRQNDAEVGLEITTQDPDQNRRILRGLRERKQEIEDAFGGALAWDEEEGRRSCHIRYVVEQGGYRDDAEKWPGIQDAMVDAMVRLSAAISPHLRAIG